MFVHPGQGLKAISVGKTETGREFQYLGVMGTNVLANELVQHLSNLTTKECRESAKRVPWGDYLF